jgi:hypothetical protein
MLSAVSLLRKFPARYRDAPFYRRYAYDPSEIQHDLSPVTITTTFAVKDKTVSHTAQLQLITDEHNRDAILSIDESWYAWDFLQSRKRIRIPMRAIAARQSIYDDDFERFYMPVRYLQRTKRPARDHLRDYPSNLAKALEDIVRTVLSIRYYSAAQFTDPSSCPVAVEVDVDGSTVRGPAMGGHKSLLYDMYRFSRDETGRFKEFLSLIDQDGLGLIDGIAFQEQKVSSSTYDVHIGGRLEQKERKKLLIIPQFMIGQQVLSPSQLSEGTFKTISLLFRLVTQETALLLIEEPEVCVHHGLLASIVEIIRSYSADTQIVMTTHSEVVLDHVAPDDVFSVVNEADRGTTVRKIEKALKGPELNALKQFLQTEGTLGEYWRSSGFEAE